MTHQQEQSSLMQAFAAMPPGQRTALPIHLFPRRRQTPVDENSRPERADFAPLARGDTFQQRHIGGQIMTPGGKLANAVGRLHQYRSEEHTSELQSLMRISYAVLCLKNKTNITNFDMSHILIHTLVS